jgi:hypothetical protein
MLNMQMWPGCGQQPSSEEGCHGEKKQLLTNKRYYTPRNSVINQARDSVVVKALCYKPEGRRYETR